MSDLKQRLVSFARKQYDFGQNKFEEYCGIPRGTINNIKEGGGISTTTLTKILVKCPELNPNWLLLGEDEGEEMLNSPVRSESSSTIANGSIPLIPIEAIAGPGVPVYEDEKDIEFYSVPAFRNSDFLIRVKGDSMTPKFTGGDLVACKKIDMQSVYFIQWNRVYVVYTQSQGVMIKRLQPSEREDCIKCVSDNEKYAPFDVPKSDIVSLALVNGSISLE